MATTTVNNLTALTAADSGDKIPIWDITAGQYKAITKANLVGGAMSGTSLTIPQTTVDVAQDLWIADPANTLSKNFGLRVENAIFNGVRDTVYTLGFNRGADRDLAQAAINFQWEDHYQYGAALSRSEFMLQCYAPSGIGGTITRPWQVNLEHQSDSVIQGFVANSYGFYFRGAYDDTGVYYFGIGPTVVTIGGGIYLRFDVNNAAAIKQISAAGTGHFDVLKLDSSDRIVIGTTGGTGTTVYVPTASTFDGVVTMNVAGTGSTLPIISAAAVGYPTFQHQIKANIDAVAATNGLVFGINTGVASTTSDVLALRGNKRIGVNDTAPDGTLHVQTADAAAVPVLLLEQLDVSEEMIEFTSVEGEGSAIEDVGTKLLTTTEYIKVTVNGNVRHFAVGTIATPP